MYMVVDCRIISLFELILSAQHTCAMYMHAYTYLQIYLSTYTYAYAYLLRHLYVHMHIYRSQNWLKVKFTGSL